MSEQEKYVQQRLKEAEKILEKYLATAMAPARGKNKFDLTYCDDLARGYFAKHDPAAKDHP